MSASVAVLSSRRQRRLLPAALAVALLVAACWRRGVAFVAGCGSGRGAAAPARVALRVNIFDSFQLPKFGGDALDPEEIGTRAQRMADESTSRVVECNMPLGIQFEERDGGDIYIKSVDEDSDAYDQGVRPGAQLVMLSATFGDEMWNAKGVGMTQFTTVVNSRFGSTMKLALEKEDKNLLSGFFAALAPQLSAEEQKRKIASLEDEFEREEARLENTKLWNPFR